MKTDSINELLTTNFREITVLAKSFKKRNPQYDFDDIYSNATLIAVELAGKYDPSKSKFKSYLSAVLPKRLHSSFRSTGYKTRMFIKSVQTFMEHYLNENGMYPDAKDIAIAFEIDEAALKSRIGRNASQVLLQSFEDITEPVDTVTIERMILKDEIAQFMSTCNVHTRIVAELYMDSDDYTFEEAVRNISGTYGLKKSAAERIVEEALEAIIGFLENIGITKDDVEEVVSDRF